ncbi:MAG: hypothetical protein AAGE94_13595 [Acidobacteriota bacterium]
MKTSWFTTIALLPLLAAPVAAQEVFADWTSADATGASGSLDTIGITVSVDNLVNAGASFPNIVTSDGAANYPDVWFTPTPPTGLDWLSGGIGNTSGAAVGSAEITVSFSESVDNPKFHFLNLDNGTVDFGAVTIARLSGNPEFEVTGNVGNATPAEALAGGCEDALGNNPNGACGTVEIAGPIASVTFVLTDTNLSTGSGDGFNWTLSIPPQLDPTVDVPTLSALGGALLALLLAGLGLAWLRR